MDTNLDPLGGLLVSPRIAAKPVKQVTKAQLGEKPVVLGAPGESSKRVARSSSPSSVIVLLSVSIPKREVQKAPEKEAELTSSPLGPVPVVSSDVQVKPSVKLLEQPILSSSCSSSSSSSSTSSSSSSSSSMSSSISGPAVLGGEDAVRRDSESSLAQKAKIKLPDERTELRKAKAMLLLKEMHEPSFSPHKFFDKHDYDSLKSIHRFKTYFRPLVTCNAKKIKRESVLMDACCSFAFELLRMSNQLLKETQNVKGYFKEATYTCSSNFSDLYLYHPRPGRDRLDFTFDQVFGLITGVVLSQLAKFSEKHESLEIWLTGVHSDGSLLCVPLLHSLLLINDKGLLEGIYEVCDGLYKVREELQITNFERIKNFILSILAGEDFEKIRAISDRMAKSWKLGELEVGDEGKAREQGAKGEK